MLELSTSGSVYYRIPMNYGSSIVIPSPGNFVIHVKTLTGNTLDIYAEPDWDVLTVKAAIYGCEGIPPY